MAAADSNAHFWCFCADMRAGWRDAVTLTIPPQHGPTATCQEKAKADLLALLDAAINGVSDMYDEDGAAEATLVSLNQLRSALVELSTALNETLRDERSNAAACLQRARAMLRGVEPLAPALFVDGSRKGLAPWQLRRVLAHIDANLSATIRNQELANLAHLSPFHFNVAFRRSVGESPHAHIIRRRVERAQGLMLATAQPLSAIAVECGLADQAHLTRLFRRIVGESPAAWRRARASPV